MKVRFSQRATDDIIQIADYLIERNAGAARAVEIAIPRMLYKHLLRKDPAGQHTRKVVSLRIG